MGGDGGTIPVSRNYVKGATKKHTNGARVDSSFQAATQGDISKSEADADIALDRIGRCALSGAKLQEPVVACGLGLLYNHEAVLEALLNKTLIPPNENDILDNSNNKRPRKDSENENENENDANALWNKFWQIKSRADVVHCEFTPNPSYPKNEELWVKPNTGNSKFMCPITRLEFNGKNKFVVLWPSGKVLSLKAVAQFPDLIEDNQEIVHLFPETDDEKLQAISQVRNRRAKRKSSISDKNKNKNKNKKKNKKRKIQLLSVSNVDKEA